ncbi:hypothetical protein ACFLU5_01125 [Bacteroidota bacterium]
MSTAMKATLILFIILSSRVLYSQPVNSIHSDKDEVFNIGSQLELFVDTLLIHEFKNVRLHLHEPKDEGTVLIFDKPWEGPFCGYATIIKDHNKYRFYYRGLPEAGRDGSETETTCYAESDDGIQWTKPNLGIYEVSGTYNNNVILANDAPFSHNFCPFRDTKDGIPPGEKFKAVAGTKETGLVGFISADGIHWEKIKGESIFTKGIFDSQNVVFWSRNEDCYVCYFRTWTQDGYSGIRTVSRTTSKDFIHWSDPVYMNFGDTQPEHLYTNQTHPYFRAPHIYIATAARFMPERQILTERQAQQLNVNPKYFKDCSDVIFMTSRGGTTYNRIFMEAFIKPGIGLQNWVSRSNYPVLNIVQTGSNEMSIYVNQNYAQPTSHIRRYSLRIDGFVSITAPHDGGEFLTKPIIFDGKNLYLNYATSAAGRIQVEIQEIDGRPITGYSLTDANVLIGNEIRRIVTWKDRIDLSEISGEPVRLLFKMKDADLYSLKFE